MKDIINKCPYCGSNAIVEVPAPSSSGKFIIPAQNPPLNSSAGLAIDALACKNCMNLHFKLATQ